MSGLADFLQAVSHLQTALDNKNESTLSAKDFRIFINCTRSNCEIQQEVLEQVSKNLLLVLSRDNLCNDSQIVVAMAYSSIIAYIHQDLDKTFQHFLSLLQEKNEREFKIYLCHAILQLHHKLAEESRSKEPLLQEIFHQVNSFCSELRSTSFLAFKVLNSLLCKIHQLYPSGGGISRECFISVMDIVMNNWENPLTGVRQQNSLVLNQLLTFSQDLWKTALPQSVKNQRINDNIQHCCFIEIVLNELSWSMKSKYFLLTAVLQKSNVSQVMSAWSEDIVAGLVLSLSVPHLVSAGTDVYRVVTAELSTSDWQHYFLPAFSHILTSSCVSLSLENLFSYWMQATIKQSPGILEELLGTNLNLYSYIVLHKIGRKEGHSCSNLELVDKNRLKLALEDYSDKIRSQAFSLICTCSKMMTFPTEEEFMLIKDFLRQNVNADSSRFRQNLLNSFTNVIIRLRDSMLFAIKTKHFDLVTKSQCFPFLDWVHTFLLFNLKADCNYQRKITSLEMYTIILTYFGHPVKQPEKAYTRKSNKDHLSLNDQAHKFSWEYKFETHLSRETLLNCLFDEDNDVRSSSADILMTHFTASDKDFEEFEKLLITGIKLSTDQMFYKAESGALIIQVVGTLSANSLSSSLTNKIFSKNTTFLNALLSSAEAQFESLQEDLLKAAFLGSFLYGTLQAIALILTDSSSPVFMSLDDNQLERLLSLMEKVTSHFIAVLSSKSDTNSDYAPSFGEMGMAVAAVVECTSLQDVDVTMDKTDDASGDLHLTPAQQLVLNCIWLNLKECCRISSQLVGKPLTYTDTKRCVTLVTSVLMRCRHKGAIESAGLALAQITRHVTASSDSRLVALPHQLLNDFLQSIVGNTSGTVSRRSAGLAILVHRLITGDARPNKSLLHDCVSRLLPIATSPVVADDKLTDLPQSQALHFLRTLVQESALRQHMAQYTLPISLAALSSLSCPVWTIRNAALQLFGALVPKLVGQKPHQEEGKGTHHLAFEELQAHAEPLVKMMLSEFSAAGKSNSMTVHSKLMPLLTLVTNLRVGLQSLLKENITKLVQQFQDSFQLLFKSNIHNVRKLSAKAHALFLTCSQIVPMIEERVDQLMTFFEGQKILIQSENELHGYVFNVCFLLDRFVEEKVGMSILLNQEDRVDKAIERLSQKIFRCQNSYFLKSLVFEMKLSKHSFDNLTDHSIELKSSLGQPLFIDKHLSYIIPNMEGDEIQSIVEFCLLKNSIYDVQLSCLNALKTLVKVKWVHSDNKPRLIKLFLMLKEFSMENSQNSELFALTLEIMLFLLSSIDLENAKELFCPKFLETGFELLYSSQTSATVLIYLLPALCGVISTKGTVDVTSLRKVTSFIKSRADPDYDQDVRLFAAQSLVILLPVLKDDVLKESNCGGNIWESCLEFLQDEVPDIRFEASRFVTFFVAQNPNYVWNTFHSLECLFKLDTVSKLMSNEEASDVVIKRLLYNTQKLNYPSQISNPFHHGVKSIYAEKGIMSGMAYQCLLESVRRWGHTIMREKLDKMCKDFEISSEHLNLIHSLNDLYLAIS